mgnify:CR=1 FL=1
MAGKSSNSFGAKNWSPGSPATRYNVSGKNREFYTFENAPGVGAYASGGTIIDGGDGYIYHIFTGNGTFAVNRPSEAIDSVDYLIVAGGGGHGSSQPFGGGGGGGGMLFGNINVSNAPGSYPISVGAGGPNSPTVPTPAGRSGSPSTAFGLVVAGGGGGATPGPPVAIATGANGGSGGGASPITPFGPGGTGNTPTLIPRQGYPGGNAPSANYGGGGGGAGGVGATGGSGVGGAGGPGRIDPNFPSTIVAKAIPAPVLPTWQPLVGPSGYAAGGQGSSAPVASSRSTPANSGYGGNFNNTTGGSGIVCVRYKKTSAYSRATGGTIEPSTHPEHPGVWRHIFTSPGDFTVTDPTLQWIDYLAVAGGGGGGGGTGGIYGGGGGAGGFVSSIHTSTTTPTTIPEAYPWNLGYSVRVGEQMPVGVASYPVTIGAGGASATTGSNTTIGSPGANQIIAYGGGAGASFSNNGGAGGSGGGASKPAPSVTPYIAGAAAPAPLIQGNPGAGAGITPAVQVGAGGGGAGAGAPTLGSGAAGPGWYSVLSPSAYGTPGPLTPTPQYRYFAGGGGGFTTPSGVFPGGAGGGGTGQANPGGPGTTNTGGGGGAGNSGTGGTGGSGIVIIQYPE